MEMVLSDTENLHGSILPVDNQVIKVKSLLNLLFQGQFVHYNH